MANRAQKRNSPEGYPYLNKLPIFMTQGSASSPPGHCKMTQFPPFAGRGSALAYVIAY